MPKYPDFKKGTLEEYIKNKTSGYERPLLLYISGEDKLSVQFEREVLCQELLVYLIVSTYSDISEYYRMKSSTVWD